MGVANGGLTDARVVGWVGVPGACDQSFLSLPLPAGLPTSVGIT